MKKIVYLIAVCLVLMSTNNLFALENTYGSSKGGKELRKVGAAGAQFLKIPVGARGSAIGAAYSSMVNDLSAIYWNPAGLADVRAMAGEFSYTQWLFDFSHNFAAASMPIGENFVVSAHVTSLNSSDIEITTVERPEGTGYEYQASDVAVGVTFAGYLTDQFSFGITAKFVNNSFAEMDANGIASMSVLCIILVLTTLNLASLFTISELNKNTRVVGFAHLKNITTLSGLPQST